MTALTALFFLVSLAGMVSATTLTYNKGKEVKKTMKNFNMFAVCLIVIFLSVTTSHAMLYEFDGTFGPTATDPMFESLENEAFSGTYDDVAKIFSFNTTGYEYNSSDVKSWLDYGTQSIIFVDGGNYFDVRDTDGKPHTLWIKSGGSAMIGGSVSASPVPIPAAAWFLGSGLLALIGIRRKKSI